ncbi:MAG: hypothetical protein ACREJG_09045 [Candidatus Rokuibacteriota bacterium]
MVLEAVGPFLLLIAIAMAVATGMLLWSLRRLRRRAERLNARQRSSGTPAVPEADRREDPAGLNGHGRRRAS